MRGLAVLLTVAGIALSAVTAGAVTVTAVASDLDFGGSDILVVELTVDDAQGLTGLEFSVVYPADMLAIDVPATHQLGGMFSHTFVNYEAHSTDLDPGLQRIAVAFSVAVPVAQPNGTLLTISLPVRCSDFGGAWPEGRPVTIGLQDGGAWKAFGDELPAPVPVTLTGRTVTVDCTSVPVPATGFSTLKARHGAKGGER